MHHPPFDRLDFTLFFVCVPCSEYATGGDLFGELQRSRPGGLASRAAASYLSQLLRAVAHLHRCAVLHRCTRAAILFFDLAAISRLYTSQ